MISPCTRSSRTSTARRSSDSSSRGCAASSAKSQESASGFLSYPVMVSSAGRLFEITQDRLIVSEYANRLSIRIERSGNHLVVRRYPHAFTGAIFEPDHEIVIAYEKCHRSRVLMPGEVHPRTRHSARGTAAYLKVALSRLTWQRRMLIRFKVFHHARARSHAQEVGRPALTASLDQSPVHGILLLLI